MDAYTEIVTLAGVPPTLSGGGRGQKGEVRLADGTLVTSAGGTSRAQVLSLLANAVRDWADERKAAEAKAAVAKAVKIVTPIPEPVPAKAVRGPRACDVSCLFAHSTKCVCQCEGANHMAGWLLFGLENESLDGPKRVKAGRVCACGCGGTTKGGKFLQGHDRRYHARFMDDGAVDLDRFFKDDDEAGLVLTPAGRKALVAAKKAR